MESKIKRDAVDFVNNPGLLNLPTQELPGGRFNQQPLNTEIITMTETRPSLDDLTRQLIDFRDARDWRQFHSLKDLILSLNLEAGELLELAQWKPEKDFEEQATSPAMNQRLQEECADVLLYLLLIAERAGIDLQAAAANKIAANDRKYPVDKSRGTSTKYTDL